MTSDFFDSNTLLKLSRKIGKNVLVPLTTMPNNITPPVAPS